jgi:hypothetical protein
VYPGAEARTDGMKVTEDAIVEKYTADQVAKSREILGREPTAIELRRHHSRPGDGVTVARGNSKEE